MPESVAVMTPIRIIPKVFRIIPIVVLMIPIVVPMMPIGVSPLSPAGFGFSNLCNSNCAREKCER